jgi:CxxC motif-containing protein (DUF1111 family)
MRRAALTLAAIGLAVFSATWAAAPTLRERLLAVPLSPALGGATTRIGGGPDAFTFLMTNAGPERARAFSFGNRLFNTNWVEAPGSVKSFDGLGPTFNRVSCSACHTEDGRGRPPEATGAPMDSMLVRISIPGPGDHGGPQLHPAYGGQLNERAIRGVPPEGRTEITYEDVPGTYGDGSSYLLQRPVYSFRDLAFGSLDGALISPRVAPQMIGLGLLESVPEATLEAIADPDDADDDGISGRVNRVWSDAAQAMRPGRFGWKANKASMTDQAAGAALGDIGLTSRLHPEKNCPESQADCRAAYVTPEADGPDLSDAFLEKLVFYSQAIAVPQQRNAEDREVRQGEALFRSAGCASCHMPALETGPDAVLPELANQVFHPFTDLLLHDMGPGLADGRPDFEATGSEWRTPPLWGLGLVETVNGHDRLLHDGRARGFAEAILWHGGEAEAAKEAFRTMPAEDRAALIAFLKSL